MKKKNIFKICVDSLMTVLLPLLMAYGLVGEDVHEWIGMTILFLFVVHHILNRHWWKLLKLRTDGALRMINTVVDILLCIDMFLLGFSGIVLSRYLFAFIPFFGSMKLARNCHMLASYWGFALMSIHMGLHWNTIIGRIKAAMPDRDTGKIGKYAANMLTVVISSYGIYAFHQRQIGVYMLHKSHFVFLDYSEPLAYFLFDYVSIIILFAAAAYYISRAIQKHSNKKSGKGENP